MASSSCSKLDRNCKKTCELELLLPLNGEQIAVQFRTYLMPLLLRIASVPSWTSLMDFESSLPSRMRPS